MRIIVPLEAKYEFKAAFREEFGESIEDKDGFEESVNGFGVCFHTGEDGEDAEAIRNFAKGFVAGWERHHVD